MRKIRRNILELWLEDYIFLVVESHKKVCIYKRKELRKKTVKGEKERSSGIRKTWNALCKNILTKDESIDH